MGNKFSIPAMSLVYFTMAIIWTIGAAITYGEKFFWLFALMVPANIFAGIRMMRR